MKEFEIEVGSLVTINECDTFVVKAEALKEAKEKAIEKFRLWLDSKYAYVDFDDVEFGYISETEL